MKEKTKDVFMNNSFDIIRLFAALLVMYGYIVSHLQLSQPEFLRRLHSFFPGVIVLFFVSGYLIIASVDREKNSTNIYKKSRYFLSRFTRIYPGLIVSFLISVISILVLYRSSSTFRDWCIWAISQVTIFQFYSPDFLAGYGVGAPNGSLWTIPIEIQWYIIAWFLYAFLKKSRVRHICLIVISVIASCVYPFLQFVLPRNIWLAIDLTVIPYMYLFLLGAYFYLYRDKIIPFLSSKWIWCVVLYFVWSFANSYLHLFTLGTYTNVISGLLLCIMIFSVGYATGKKRLSIDISYGIYIYHMIIVNIVVEVLGRGNVSYAFLVVAVTMVLAVCSWFLVEKPSMNLKNKLIKK